MPAARATSASVIADQSRLSSNSRIASSTESRRRARDASAYGTLCFTSATLVVTNGRLPPSRSRTSPHRSPGSSSLRGCRPSGGRARYRLPASPWLRRTRSRTAHTRTVCSRSFRYLHLEIDLFAYGTVGAAPVCGYLVPACSRWKSFSCSAFGFVVDVGAAGATVGDHHAVTP